MADILIKGLVLPKEGHIEAHIWCNGTVTYRKKIDNQWDKNSTTAIELPSHGRLCDLDALIEHETYNIEQALFDTDEVLEDLKNTPVIVEASNADN